VKWFVTTESHVKKANELLASDVQLIAPDLMRTEASNAIRRLAVQGKLTMVQAQERFVALGDLIALRLRVEDSEKHLQAAFDIALKAPRRHVQDAIYLAIALAEGCQVITADDVFFKTLVGTEYEAHAVFLGAN
jgi:predicted nucleic acid-binding protein